MGRVFILASVIAFASAWSDLAFAQFAGGQAVSARGQAVNECRAVEKPDMNNHHARLAIKACVHRVLQGGPAVD